MRKGQAGCQPAPESPPPGLEYATFAGGCFWSVELQFQRTPGVEQTWVGYTQGSTENPTYEMVCTEGTGHTEAVLMTYNPKECSFDDLMTTFLAKTDVTTLNRQGNDRGTQYRSGVYYHNDEQKAVAERRLQEHAEKIGRPAVAEVKPAAAF